MTRGELGIVEQWHAAVNDGDAAGAGALCAPDVEIGGPRGTGYGRELVVEWVGHAGIRLQAHRWFCGAPGDDGTVSVVVEQDARWPDGSGGHTEPVRVATAYRVREDVLVSLVRHADLGRALDAVGLATGDEVLTRA